MMEIWKPIDGYNGRYEVSNMGRIKSYAENAQDGKLIYGVITKLGYHNIRLYDGKGGFKTFPVHRLVALAFLPNPFNLSEVNHIDENKRNNRVENLEWCSRDYNVNFGMRNKKTSIALLRNEYTSKKVYSIDGSGRIDYYDSIGEAERQTGCSHSNIVRTLKGRTSHCGHRQWFYC